MYNLTTKGRKLDLPVDIQCQLFDRPAMPIVLYISEIWKYGDTQVSSY